MLEEPEEGVGEDVVVAMVGDAGADDIMKPQGVPPFDGDQVGAASRAGHVAVSLGEGTGDAGVGEVVGEGLEDGGDAAGAADGLNLVLAQVVLDRPAVAGDQQRAITEQLLGQRLQPPFALKAVGSL